VTESDGNGLTSHRQPTGKSPLISVVVPVYSEQELLAEFYARTKKVLGGLDPTYRHEILFVDDGSTDRSPEILAELARSDSAVRVISFARNFGHQIAITAGLDHARGDVAVIIDSDLQDPPEVIPQMLDKWKEGFKVVYGVRIARDGETGFKRATAKAFYRLLSHLSDTPIPIDSGDFRLIDRKVIDALGEIREQSRYLRGLVSWIGFKQCGVPYHRDSRQAGATKFPLRKMMAFALDGISSFSERPLRLSSHLGFLATAASILAMLFIIVGKLMHPELSVGGWASVMVAVLFLGGVQLVCIGILGEYIGRIFRQAKARPLYIVADRINFTEPQVAQQSAERTL